jgi:PAS domain S-box-containing protein
MRRAEVDLRRSEERFRQGFDNAPIGMALVDPANLAFLRVNDAFCTMVGRTRDALDELKFADMSHPEDLSRGRENVRRLLTGELDHYITDKRYVRPDGSEVWASVNITPVRDPDGDVDVLFGQMVDITERKQREASLAPSSRTSPGSGRSGARSRRIASSCTLSRSSTSPRGRRSSASC